jgi:hypothetical protein
VSAIELIDSDPVIEECDYPKCRGGAVGDQWCPRCGGSGYQTFDRSAILTLAHNLAIAGALASRARLAIYLEVAAALRATGERGSEVAALLVEQLADEVAERLQSPGVVVG